MLSGYIGTALRMCRWFFPTFREEFSTTCDTAKTGRYGRPRARANSSKPIGQRTQTNLISSLTFARYRFGFTATKSVYPVVDLRRKRLRRRRNTEPKRRNKNRPAKAERCMTTCLAANDMRGPLAGFASTLTGLPNFEPRHWDLPFTETQVTSSTGFSTNRFCRTRRSDGN